MEAYRLAILEDDGVIREELCSLCRGILEEKKIDCRITAFAKARELEQALGESASAFDLLLLDIQMEGMTGMELAKKLRREGNRVSIIFITGCDAYLPEGYEVQPIHFLLKPVNRERLAAALQTDWELNHRPKSLVLRNGARTVTLPVDRIRYIESLNHNIIVHMGEEDRVFPMSLSEAEKRVPPGQFCRCHNSFLINLEYVAEIERTELALSTGERLPVGRTRYSSFQSAFISYINR